MTNKIMFLLTVITTCLITPSSTQCTRRSSHKDRWYEQLRLRRAESIPSSYTPNTTATAINTSLALPQNAILRVLQQKRLNESLENLKKAVERIPSTPNNLKSAKPLLQLLIELGKNDTQAFENLLVNQESLSKQSLNILMVTAITEDKPGIAQLLMRTYKVEMTEEIFHALEKMDRIFQLDMENSTTYLSQIQDKNFLHDYQNE